MESVAHISHSGSSVISNMWVGGDLVLNQQTPLPASGRGYMYESLINTSSRSWEDYQLSTILNSYNQRDCESNHSSSDCVDHETYSIPNF